MAIAIVCIGIHRWTMKCWNTINCGPAVWPQRNEPLLPPSVWHWTPLNKIQGTDLQPFRSSTSCVNLNLDFSYSDAKVIKGGLMLPYHFARQKKKNPWTANKQRVQNRQNKEWIQRLSKVMSNKHRLVSIPRDGRCRLCCVETLVITLLFMWWQKRQKKLLRTFL